MYICSLSHIEEAFSHHVNSVLTVLYYHSHTWTSHRRSLSTFHTSSTTVTHLMGPLLLCTVIHSAFLAIFSGLFPSLFCSPCCHLSFPTSLLVSGSICPNLPLGAALLIRCEHPEITFVALIWITANFLAVFWFPFYTSLAYSSGRIMKLGPFFGLIRLSRPWSASINRNFLTRSSPFIGYFFHVYIYISHLSPSRTQRQHMCTNPPLVLIFVSHFHLRSAVVAYRYGKLFHSSWHSTSKQVPSLRQSACAAPAG